MNHPDHSPNKWCSMCGETTRYFHRQTACKVCGAKFCRQKKTAKYCSERCKSAHRRGAGERAVEMLRLRAEVDALRQQLAARGES